MSALCRNMYVHVWWEVVTGMTSVYSRAHAYVDRVAIYNVLSAFEECGEVACMSLAWGERMCLALFKREVGGKSDVSYVSNLMCI